MSENTRRAKKAWRTRKKKKGNRGNLIKGMTNKFPAHIFDNEHFEAALEKVLKKYSGIYVLYNNDKPYYVGLATDLDRRMRHHLRDKHKGRWTTFKIFRIAKIKYLKDLETLILNIDKPEGNKITGRLPSIYKLTEPFKNALREEKKALRKEEKRIEEIRKALK